MVIFAIWIKFYFEFLNLFLKKTKTRCPESGFDNINTKNDDIIVLFRIPGLRIYEEGRYHMT